MPADPKRETPRPAAAPSTAAKPAAAETAKAALRRLALSKLEPTPENYARAWAEEGGASPPAAEAPAPAPASPRAKAVFERLAVRAFDEPALRDELAKALLESDWDNARRLAERAGEAQAAQSQAWALTIERLARGLERGGRQWTSARKKDSLQRVLDNNRSDLVRLGARLKQLVASWDGDAVDDPVAIDAEAEAAPDDAPVAGPAAGGDWPPVLGHYDAALRSALPAGDARAEAVAGELRELLGDLQRQGVTSALLAHADEVCARARRVLEHRHRLVDELHRLTHEMSAGLGEVAEDESWVKGQTESLKESLGATPSVRSVRAASRMLAETRARQRGLREERDRARLALKDAIQKMLTELDELGDHTGRFSDSVAHYVETVASADSLESLAGVVRQMVEESRAVHGLVSQAREKLADGHRHALELEERVRSLEGELRKLSDEVSTDVLTEIANRRGLMQAFEIEQARLERQGGELAIGLLDVDNFKKLNDTLGHSVGDTALKSLAAHVHTQLRPVDVVARFGGEEFVVLLPGTAVEEAQQTLTRLQRTLSASLFMHDGREVFVTFSAGVTKFRAGEALETALERADEALYEAKRTGKNRTCIG
jgi:diguanylate cyclase